ncbi:putative ADP-ribosylation factor-like protein 5C isoform X2 [Microtus pennsylvanicus]|uniref:putative ADP-ribosylation factor-like protein 5C isoform X2 n=1 Tax=Microtus pennsylvanicus TaxID=10058 RepID=UPI003F6AD7C8
MGSAHFSTFLERFWGPVQGQVKWYSPSPRGMRFPAHPRDGGRGTERRIDTTQKTEILSKWLEHKVIIVGLDNAGKTTILHQFLSNEVVHTCSTIGSNVEEIVLRKTRFLMWDLGGQEALRSSWDTYYSSTEFVILVIDSTDRNRLLTTREELYKMLVHEALQDASVLIFANKQDVKDSMSPAEISQFLTLSAITEHPWHIQGCCALTGEGLPAGLQWMQSQTMTN